ncbi:MAG: hypothetical protein HY566_01265 [Candidatus Kerfeldbacteria bacterium]|nr:hypothetical protein [Candidatus Kerfeldbacteria bacterium]
MKNRESGQPPETDEPEHHLDDALREFGSHLDDWYRHLQEEVPREKSMDVREFGLAHWLEEAEIPEDKKEEVLQLVERYLRFVEETKDGDHGAIAAMERLKEKIESTGQ